MRPTCLLMAAAAIATACATPSETSTMSPVTASGADLKREVTDTERAFARTMADGDHAAFTRFVSEEAVFFSGATALRGRQAVASHWARFYAKPQAPFSWEPEQVEVLDSGNLALSSGPVRDPHGKLIARFTSIWRREAPGTWRIVFDKGSDVCE